MIKASCIAIVVVASLVPAATAQQPNCTWVPLSPSQTWQSCWIGIGDFSSSYPGGHLHIKAAGASVYTILERSGTGVDAALRIRTAGNPTTDWTLGKSGNDYSENLYLSYGGTVTDANTFMTFTPTGSIGIGTESPHGRLHLASPNLGHSVFHIVERNSNGSDAGLIFRSEGNPATDWLFGRSGTTYSNRLNIGYGGNPADGSWNTVMTFDPSGNVGIGLTQSGIPAERLHVKGNLHVEGNANFTGSVQGASIKAHYQDVAEWVPASEPMPAGYVVILDAASLNTVKASQTAYDTSVAGVVSEFPGIILGEEGPGKVKVATTGRVKVRVDASRGPIAVGDLLVTSDIRGTAMRSEPAVMNGRPFHQPGTLIGKALEPLAKGTGEILVLLSLQ